MINIFEKAASFLNSKYNVDISLSALTYLFRHLEISSHIVKDDASIPVILLLKQRWMNFSLVTF